MSGLRRYAIGIIGLVISLLAVYSIVSEIGIERLVEAFRNANYIYILPCSFLILLGLIARGIRWRALLNHDLSISRAFNIMNVAYMVNAILPMRLGEVARAYLASQASEQVAMVRALSTIVVERLLDVIAVLIILGFAITSAPLPDEVRGIAAAAAPAVGIGFIMLVVMSAQRKRVLMVLAALIRSLPFIERFHLVETAGHFLDGLSPLTQPAFFFKVVLWTTIAWGFSLVSGYVLMPGFFGMSDWTATHLFSAAASFANALPAMPGSIGTYEYSILISFQSLGYADAAVITGFAVMIHALNLGINALLGIYGIAQEGISLSQLSERVRAQAVQSVPDSTL